MLGEFDAAINLYRQSQYLHPNDVDAWNNKGYALYNLERYDEAIGIEITNRISL